MGIFKKGIPGLHVLEVGPPSFPARSPPVRLLLTGWKGPFPDALSEEPETSVLPTLLAVASDEQGSLFASMEALISPRPPEAQALVSGHRLRLWRIRGHSEHRRLTRELQTATLRAIGAASSTHHPRVGILSLADPGVGLRPVHRAVRGLRLFRPEPFLRVLSSYARLEEFAIHREEALAGALRRVSAFPRPGGAFVLLLEKHRAYSVTLRQRAVWAARRSPLGSTAWSSLALVRAEALVLDTALGLRSNSGSLGEAHVFAVENPTDIWRGVGRREYQLGLLFPPPGTWALRAVMAASQRLPAHTVRFSPLPPDHGYLYAPDRFA